MLPDTEQRAPFEALAPGNRGSASAHARAAILTGNVALDPAVMVAGVAVVELPANPIPPEFRLLGCTNSGEISALSFKVKVPNRETVF
jgi:hypothetical protein